MANVLFKKGLHASLPTSGAVEGAFYLTTDSDRLYVGKADGTLADLNKYVKIIATLNDGATLPEGQEGDFLYIQDSNILAVYTGGKWKQVNPDTDTNTTYDIKATTVDNVATVQLGSKNIGDSEVAWSDKFKVVGTGTASVSVADDTITINVPATDLSDYYTKSAVDGLLAPKADKTYVDDELAKKADKSVVDGLVNTTIPGLEDRIDEIVETTIPGVEDRIDEIVETTIPGLANVYAGKTAFETLESEVHNETTGLATKASKTELQNVDAKFANYEPVGAEERAKAYVDAQLEDADLAQYTTESEVKEIVDKVIVDAVDGDTITGLTNLVQYINTHGGEAAEMASAIDVLEGKVEVVEAKPAYGITATQISNWDNEVGAKALAETKRTEAEVNSQIDAKIEALALGTMSKETATDYVKKAEAPGYDDILTKTAAASAYQAKGEYYTKTEANALLADKADKSDTYTKTEVDTKIEEAALAWGEF